jgi:GT2 family glycosyltransferase
VIVPTFNGQRWIPEQLAALSRQSYARPWELIVAENGSTDGTRSVAVSTRERFADFRLVDASDVRGQSHARNRAAREAGGDLLLFTDHDDIVGDDWIAQLTDGLQRSPIVTGPVAHFTDGKPPSGDNLQQPQTRSRFGPFIPAIGCNMGIRRDLFFDLGGFDETIRTGWEDIDLGIRAGLRGFSTEWVEHAVVLHRRPGSARAMWRKEFTYGRGFTMLERRYPDVSSQGWARALLGRAGWVAVRVPYLAMPTRRRAWVVRAAGVAGRVTERVRPSA